VFLITFPSELLLDELLDEELLDEDERDEKDGLLIHVLTSVTAIP